MEGKIEIRVQAEPWYAGLALLVKMQGQGHCGFGKSVQFVEVPEGEVIEPTLRFTYREAQVLMDDLWQCGLRPSEGIGSAGQLAATERHLKDMQKIVFGTLKLDKE